MMNVKGLKKCLAGVSTLGLALSLAACNNKDEQIRGKGYTLSDIVNSKEKHQIIVTNKDSSEDDDHENDHVVWAGFIGKGQIEGIYLDGMIYDYGYKDMKNQSDKELRENLTDMGEDYDVGGRDNNSTFATAQAGTKLYTDLDDMSANPDNDDLADVVSLDAKFKDHGQFNHGSGLTESVSKPAYSNVQKESNKEWITYTSNADSGDTANYQMHIKMGETNLKPQIENVKDTLKKYKNAKEEE
ncbi:hypothetical protein [Staphylococcus warneri]|uniref:hypothetical protein n=2 Tax=Bacteria TaxID=2 RepID=UPI00247FEFB7|nr:hypothetical protein [Staphylococcus warneri]